MVMQKWRVIKTSFTCELRILVLDPDQSLTTPSGGDGSAPKKLTKELINNLRKYCLYLMDEQTTDLNPVDVENLFVLLKRLVYSGNAVLWWSTISRSWWFQTGSLTLSPVWRKNGRDVVLQKNSWIWWWTIENRQQ